MSKSQMELSVMDDKFCLWLYRAGPTLEEAQSWAKSFEHLIKSPNGRSNFRQFLKSEFSEENLLFWLACEDLKKQTNRTVVEETVKQIYEDYVSVLSPREVYLHSIPQRQHLHRPKWILYCCNYRIINSIDVPLFCCLCCLGESGFTCTGSD